LTHPSADVQRNWKVRRACLLLLILWILAACAPKPVELGQTASATSTLTPTVTITPVNTATSTSTASSTPTETLTPTPAPAFSFVVTTDMSHYSARKYFNYPNFFAALLGYVNQFGPGDFMVSLGDVIPAEETGWTVAEVLGSEYPWFPIPGNHDFGLADIRYLQNYKYDPNGTEEPNIVRQGPASCPHTTYSFDYQNSHFVALNVYCNEETPWGIDGSISDPIYDWLAADLAATDKEHIFVFGHEPAFPQPDAQTGNVRHLYESLDQYRDARDRFWELLKLHGVVAYLSGHTHNYSATMIDGVWHIEAGQAMGVRAAPSPGTFLILTVQGESVVLQTYRGEEGPGFGFLLRDEVHLHP